MEQLNAERKEQSKPVRWIRLPDGTSVLSQKDSTIGKRLSREFSHLHENIGIPQRWAIRSLKAAVRGWMVRYDGPIFELRRRREQQLQTAATSVQRAWRGHAGRRDFEDMRELQRVGRDFWTAL